MQVLGRSRSQKIEVTADATGLTSRAGTVLLAVAGITVQVGAAGGRSPPRAATGRRRRARWLADARRPRRRPGAGRAIVRGVCALFHAGAEG